MNPRGGGLLQVCEPPTEIAEHFAQTSPATETRNKPYGGPVSPTRGCLGTHVPPNHVASGWQVAWCLLRSPLDQPRCSGPSTSEKFPSSRDFQVEDQTDWLRRASQRSWLSELKVWGVAATASPLSSPKSQNRLCPQVKVLTVAFSRLVTRSPSPERRKEGSP